MTRFVDKTGNRYGRWTVESFAGFNQTRIPHRSLWQCVCDCGNRAVLGGQTLIDGASLSCGCLQKERASAASKTHGLSKTGLYKIWSSMKRRCNSPSDPQYYLYGARGIKVCKEWADSFQAFAEHVGPKPDGRSLDRIDNSRGYEPGNVRWATIEEQLSNTRRNVNVTHNGRTMTLKQWSRELGVYYNTLRERKKNGWSDEQIVSTPVDKTFRRNYKREATLSADSR